MGTLGGNMSGIGMTSARTRKRMVERLRADGIRDEIVLEAINAIPRHIFVDEALAIRAYEDTPLPIGSGQTISQPWVVARMTELARAGRVLERVLEPFHFGQPRGMAAHAPWFSFFTCVFIGPPSSSVVSRLG